VHSQERYLMLVLLLRVQALSHLKRCASLPSSIWCISGSGTSSVVPAGALTANMVSFLQGTEHNSLL